MKVRKYITNGIKYYISAFCLCNRSGLQIVAISNALRYIHGVPTLLTSNNCFDPVIKFNMLLSFVWWRLTTQHLSDCVLVQQLFLLDAVNESEYMREVCSHKRLHPVVPCLYAVVCSWRV